MFQGLDNQLPRLSFVHVLLIQERESSIVFYLPCLTFSSLQIMRVKTLQIEKKMAEITNSNAISRHSVHSFMRFRFLKEPDKVAADAFQPS